MTQREKLRLAQHLAVTMKSVAQALEDDARTYDCTFPLGHAKRLRKEAIDYLKNV